MRISDWSSDVCSSDLHLAVEGGHAAEAPGVMILRRFLLDEGVVIVLLLDEGKRREGRQCFGEDDGTRTGPASAVRRGEGLVQVDVHRVNAEVARTDAADDRIKVRAVAIDESARVMHSP